MNFGKVTTTNHTVQITRTDLLDAFKKLGYQFPLGAEIAFPPCTRDDQPNLLDDKDRTLTVMWMEKSIG